MTKSILICGGGTGGHITPGIALYEKFKGMDINACFLAGKKDRNFSLFKGMDRKRLYFYNAPAITRNIVKFPFFIINFLISLIRAMYILAKHDIDAVVGMGGYVSAPALTAAVLRRKKIFLCEQNSIPGKVNQLFEKKASRIYSTFEKARAYFAEPSKFVFAGNPIRDNVLKSYDRNEARRAFNLSHVDKIIFVVGGSQGAYRINELVLAVKKKYPDRFKNTGFIWSTGRYSFEKFRDELRSDDSGGSVYFSPFIEDMGLAYAASDLAISRSGAGVMMELAAMGVPSILIPYPFSAMGHQELNADEFAARGASVKIGEAGLTPEVFLERIFELLDNPERLKKMSAAAEQAAVQNSSDIIADDIMKTLSAEKGE